MLLEKTGGSQLVLSLAFLFYPSYILAVIFRDRHIIAFASLLSTMMLLSCAGKSQKPPAAQIQFPQIEFPSFQWDKNGFLHLDYSAFPDSITFFLPAGQGEPLDIENAAILEDINGWADSCRFRYVRYGAAKGANVVIVEDISASMGDYIHFTDRLIWGYISMLSERNCEVALVRFGDIPERTIGWVLPDSFLSFTPESLSYPNDRGSDLIGALSEALDLIAERPSSPATIALFSDGDFEADQIPLHIIERAKRYNASINIFMHGWGPKGTLAKISDQTGGVYLVQPGGGFSPGMVAAVMAESYYIIYYPEHKAKDGALHRIRLIDPNGRWFRGEYRAPGEVPAIVANAPIAPEPFYLPDELLSSQRIPFRDSGNIDILPDAAMMLDAIAAAVNALPDTLSLVLNIRGYTCNIGPTGINMRLSKKRAYSVRDYLRPKVNGNIKFDISWFGEMYPLNANATEEQQQENRRVEISLRLVAMD